MVPMRSGGLTPRRALSNQACDQEMPAGDLSRKSAGDGSLQISASYTLTVQWRHCLERMKLSTRCCAMPCYMGVSRPWTLPEWWLRCGSSRRLNGARRMALWWNCSERVTLCDGSALFREIGSCLVDRLT